MKIIDFIIKNEMKAAQERVEKLIDLDSPEAWIKEQRKLIAGLKNGRINVKGDQDLLQLTFRSFKTKKGKGMEGKEYILFDNGVKYFPNGRFGRYITRGEIYDIDDRR